ncbi:PUA-like domain-containing protein [Mycena vulgaris]|nr:PUA-like domain-containing protein [Mycena vulgaris]
MASESEPAAAKYWLLKAEPDSRIVKGKDVKFSVDDFEAAKTSPWEGVRNYEARNLMKEMKLGEKALFYHSNCKIPGIAAFAEEAYPDHSAWDSAHPYYDPKSKQDDPKWFMVDLAFGARAEHFVPLALLRFIADAPAATPPAGLEYLGADGVAAIKSMDLVTRGRLSVQRVSPDAWAAVQLLARTGGWDTLELAPKKKAVPKKAATGAAAARPARAAKSKAQARKRKAKGSDSEDQGDDDYDEDEEEEVISKTTSSRRKRKAEEYEELPPARRARAKP